MRRRGIHLMQMNIVAQLDDAPEFVRQVELAANGILVRYSPRNLVVIKIDNWFGSKWLGFSGKVIGALGVWDKPHNRPPDNIRIPPFVPDRVVSQRRFVAPIYEEIEAGKPVHRQIPSSIALGRKASATEPGTALAWYSGNSKTNQRGALIFYVPVNSSYWAWYVALESGEHWRITESWDIKVEDFLRLVEQGSESEAAKP